MDSTQAKYPTIVPAVQPPIPPSSILSPDFEVSKIKKKKLNLRPLLKKDDGDKMAFILKNVLTPEECRALIKLSEDTGYTVAVINVGGGGQEICNPKIRGGHRVLIDDEDFAAKLYSRISSYLPTKFLERNLVGINERLRCLKYDQPGQRFAIHLDGSYTRPDESATTLITLQIYLNDGFKGGETTFFSFQSSNKKKVAVVPRAGSILVFEHKIPHEGSELVKGTKYTIRMDVLYSPVNVKKNS